MSEQHLPPHSPEAEEGILACIVCNADGAGLKLVQEVAERLNEPEAFYDLQNRTIWRAMVGLAREQKPVDSVTITQRLRDTGKLGDVGGFGWVERVSRVMTSDVNLPGWVDVVNEKWLARRGIQAALAWGAAIDGDDALTESRLEAMKRELEVLATFSARQFDRRPKNLVTFEHFEKAFYDLWFRIKPDEYGRELPFPFPFRIRPSEATLFSGDNGAGKSSFLGQASICLALQGAMPCIASMEMSGEVTAWIMSRQLLGLGHMEENPPNTRLLREAFAFLVERFSVYDFKGITNWRELLDVFRWAREHRGNDVFVVDSVMRIGIEDDNYAEQGLAASAFSNFALTTGSHVFLVLHERKSRDGSDKDRIRGSKQWSDNAHNITRLARNQTKAEQLAEWEEAVKAGEMDPKERDDKVEASRKKWDSKYVLSKQRWPASEQNASRWLYFHRDSLQFHTQPGEAPYNYLIT